MKTRDIVSGGLLATVCLVLSAINIVGAAPCRFPDEVYGTKYPWKIMSPDYTTRYPHSHRKVVFNKQNMIFYFISGEQQQRTTVYTCEDSFNEGKYMVSIHELGPVYYSCMKFIIRSRNVIQLRMAEPVHVRSPALCADVYMKLLESPLVYFHVYDDWVTERMPLNSYQPFPLEGGYVIREWRNEKGRIVYQQNANVPPIKLENECEKGEGLKFVCDRNRAKCMLPHTALHRNNNYCLGSWMEGEYTYMVMFNENDDRMIPCLRYPNIHGQQFTFEIFLDGVCDRGREITQSKRYRKLTLLKEVESYCGDRTMMCAEMDRSACSRGLKEYCRNTCGVCHNPSQFWKTLKVYPGFRGTWVKDSYSQGYENIRFDSKYVTIPSLGKYRLYEKYGYEAEEDATAHEHIPRMPRKEYLMVGTYDNGCSPRVSLLNIAKRSNAVLSLRISQPAVIERFGQTHAALDNMDRQLSFSKKSSPHMYEMYRTQPGNWFNIVLRDERPLMVHCNLRYTHFRILLKDGRFCDGYITMIDQFNFEMVFRVCNSSNVGGVFTEPPPPTQFECLASFHGEYGNAYILTRMLGGLHELVRHRYMCWAFSQKEQDTVYWMQVSDCDGSTENYIDAKARFPLAHLIVVDRSKEGEPSEYYKWLLCFVIFFTYLFGM